MMKFHKILSVVLHPVIMPTLGVLLYLYFTPLYFNSHQKSVLLSIVFFVTSVLPIFLLVVLKALKSIQSYKVGTIQERKLPMFIMMVLFFVLAKNLSNHLIFKDVSYLFYGTVLGLFIIYLTFFKKIKTSLHLMSMGSAVGYFIIFQLYYGVNVIPLITILIFLSGLLASSRLYLKAHTPKEVYLGFFVGVVSQITVFLLG